MIALRRLSPNVLSVADVLSSLVLYTTPDCTNFMMALADLSAKLDNITIAAVAT